jgi:hypothetical protein
MKPLLSFLILALALSGCYLRMEEGADSPLAHYVGRHAEVAKKIVIYDSGVFGRLGVPADEWPRSKKEKVTMSLEPGMSFEVIGVSSLRTESGKHRYLVCRHRTSSEEVTFDYPAGGKFIGAGYISWRRIKR